MLPEELISRINALANKSKEEELTKAEKEEQKKLRQEYLKTKRISNLNFVLRKEWKNVW